MHNTFKIGARIFIWIVFFCFQIKAQTQGVKKIQSATLYNLYQVDDILQRAEQPGKKALKELAQTGVKSILNLRKIKKDHQAKGTRLLLLHVGMKAGSISYNDLVSALQAINKAPKPILVHCKYGADRTGCVVAAYNMLKHNYSKEEAINDLRNGGYGFHQKWYPNIIALLNTLDVAQLKKDVEK